MVASHSSFAVLVVEDDGPLLMQTASFFEDAGYLVYKARNADEAIRLLESQPEIRVLFTDIEMPGSMNGLALAHVCRHRWPPVEIVVVSGRPKLAAHEMPKGAVFFSKPYADSAVLDTVDRFASAY
ncbi:response regulator [Aureimonas leprariae]|uniref:Response regulator n=1 Tax=Plantimonas leprariae TaxID=2615207 RepID=A0A7V7PKN4_9HYPH|nr:response regulator [Aureimonas leprariae]KAB0676294.1 response regulator [Aureimonas leprariae]